MVDQELTLKGKDFVVTGGYGFIGSHLCEKLLSIGAKRIVIIDSLEYGCQENIRDPQGRIEFVQHRLGGSNAMRLNDAMKGVDYVFHLAAEKHNQSIENPQKVIDANISGTYQILKAAAMVGVKRVIYSSSLYAYGRMNHPPMSEDEVPSPDTIYGISKVAGENLCRHFANRYGLSSICLRYFFVYGPRQYANLGYKSVILKNFERLIQGQAPEICGDGEQVLDYLYVEDVVQATLKATQASLSFEVINIGSGTGISVNTLTQAMLEIANVKQRPLYISRDSTHGSFRVAKIDNARIKLGFSPTTSLPLGLKRTYDCILNRRTCFDQLRGRNEY